MRRTQFLTGKQRVVFDFVRQRIYEGLPPSMREIGAHFGFTGRAAYNYLLALRKKGYIHWKEGRPRTLSLLPPYKDDTRYSLVVNTDIPQLDIQKSDYLLIDTEKPITQGDVILSSQGDIKRFATGDVVFGKVIGVSRALQEPKRNS